MADFQTTVELKAQTGQMTQKLKQTERNLKQVSAQVRKTQGAFTRMGKKVSGTFTRMNNKIKEHRAAIAGIGLSLGLLVAKGVKDFKEWEDGLAQIATLGVTGIKGISDELDAVRREFGISGKEATKGYYDIISAGASQGAVAMGQLTAATKLAKAGNTDLAAAIDVVTSGINIFGDNGETATSIVDQLFLAVKFGKTTVEELGKTFGYVAPVIDAAGLSMADYAASMATITAGGIATKQATTGLKAVLSNLIKVTPKAAKKAKELGLDFGVAALKAKGLVGVMQDIADATGGDVTELGNLFDSIEAINAVAVLTSNTGLKSLERNFNAMSDSAGTTEEALAKVKETASYNFGKFNQGLSIMSRSIGAAVVPSLLDMADGLAPVVDFMSALITQHPGIIKMTVAVVALGVALAFLGGPVTLAIVGVGVAIKALSDHFDLFADGGVAALEKVELVWNNFWAGFEGKDLGESIKYIFSGAGDWIASLLPEGGFTTLWTNTKTKLGEYWTSISNWFTTTDWAGLWDGTLEFSGNIWTGVSTALTKAWDGISGWFTGIDWKGLWYGTGPHGGGLLEFTGDIWQGIKDALSAAWTGISNWFTTTDWKGLWAGTLEFTGKVWDGIKVILDKAWEGITSWFTSLDGKGLWNNTLEFTGKVWDGIKVILDAAWTSISAWFTSIDGKGLWKDTLEFTGNIWDNISNHLVAAWVGIDKWFQTTSWSTLWDNTLEFSGNIWLGVKTALGKVWTGISEWFSGINWSNLWYGEATANPHASEGGLLGFAGNIWSGIKTVLDAAWTGITGWFSSTDWSGMWDNTIQFVGKVWDGIESLLTDAYTNAKAWAVKQDWKGLWDNTIQFAGKVWDGMKSLLDDAYTGAKDWAGKQDWSGMWDNTVEFASDVWTEMKSVLANVYTGAKAWAGEQDWKGIWNNTVQFVGNVWEGIETVLGNAYTGAKVWAGKQDWKGMWDNTVEFAGDIWSSVSNHLVAAKVGIDLWFQTADWSKLWGTALEFAGDIWAGVKIALSAVWTGVTNWFTSVDWAGLWSGNSAGNPHSDSAGVLGFAGDIWSGVKSVLTAMWTSLTAWFVSVDWKGLWKGTLEFTGKVWDGMKVILDDTWTSITNWFTTTNWPQLWENTLQFSGKVWEGIEPVLDDAWTNITAWFDNLDWSSLGDSVKTGMKGALAGIGSVFANVLGEEESIGGDRLGAAAVGVLATGGLVSKLWKVLLSQFKMLTARIAVYLAPLGASVLGGPVAWIALGVVAAAGLTYAFWPHISKFFTEMWDEVTAWFGSLDWGGMWDGMIDGLVGIGTSAVDTVTGWFTDIDFGGMWDGMVDSLSSVGGKIKSLFIGLLPAWVQKLLDGGNTASVTDNGGEGRGSIAPLNNAAGGSISGAGTGTSDSIPAMLSDGEFVMNAKSSKLFGPLLEAMNAQKFAKGGRVGAMKQVQKYAAGGTVSDAKSYQFLQFEEGLFSMQATIEKFIGNMDATDPAVNKVVRQLEYLQKHTGNLNEDQVLAHDYATRINQAMIDLLPKKKEEAEVTSEAAGAVKDLGDSAKKASDSVAQVKNEWEGTAQSFTGPIKQALANGGDIGDAFKQGIKGMLSRISSKLLDKAFAPLEKGIDDFINNMMSAGSGSGGGGSFLSGLFGGGGGASSGGDGGIGRVVSGLFGGFAMARGGIVPRNGMQPQYFAQGGFAKGTDTVPAMLTPGEMVLTKEQQSMMMGGQQKAGDTYNFNIEATDGESFKRMLSQDPKFLANIAEQGKQATSGLRRAR